MKIWFDITNTPQVHFLLGVKRLIENNNYEFLYTTRDFSETIKLLKNSINDDFSVFGVHRGRSFYKKGFGLLDRFFSIYKNMRDFDVSISNGSEAAVWNSWLRRKKSITFGDNDLARQWTYGAFVDYAFFPNAINKELIYKQGIGKRKAYFYDGYKEDIYLSDFESDSNFLNMLPFDNYVIVRPENIMANYVSNNNVSSITPDLLSILSKKKINVLYLPRYDFDKEYAKGIKNIFIPEEPINGLDAVYYSDGVFTGAGTLAREAACLNVPSFSFFAGERLLAVDNKLISQNKMYFSREASQLVDKFMMTHKNEPDLSRSKNVALEVREKLLEIIKKICEK